MFSWLFLHVLACYCAAQVITHSPICLATALLPKFCPLRLTGWAARGSCSVTLKQVFCSSFLFVSFLLSFQRTHFPWKAGRTVSFIRQILGVETSQNRGRCKKAYAQVLISLRLSLSNHNGALEQVAQRGCGFSFSGDMQDPPGQGPVQPAVDDPALAGELD